MNQGGQRAAIENPLLTTVMTDLQEKNMPRMAWPTLNAVSTLQQRQNSGPQNFPTGDQLISTNVNLNLTGMEAENSQNFTNCYVCEFIPHRTNKGLPKWLCPFLTVTPVIYSTQIHLAHINYAKLHL